MFQLSVCILIFDIILRNQISERALVFTFHLCRRLSVFASRRRGEEMLSHAPAKKECVPQALRTCFGPAGFLLAAVSSTLLNDDSLHPANLSEFAHQMDDCYLWSSYDDRSAILRNTTTPRICLDFLFPVNLGWVIHTMRTTN